MLIKNMTRRERYIFGATVGLVAAALLYGLVIEPVARRWTFLDKEIARELKALEKDSALLADREKLAALYAKVSPAVFSRKNEEAVVADLMAHIENVSRNDSCLLVNIKPIGAKDAGSYKELMIDVTAEGSMEQLSKFLYDIEHPRSSLLKVRRFTIAAKSIQTNNLRGTFLISKMVINR